jgi:hypothetical protein
MLLQFPHLLRGLLWLQVGVAEPNRSGSRRRQRNADGRAEMGRAPLLDFLQNVGGSKMLIAEGIVTLGLSAAAALVAFGST